MLRLTSRLLSASSSTPFVHDVLVIGGGHAGCEAAAAAARAGASTLLLTHRVDTIGEMSCNPSFGGVGKGHLMREVDALDGLCARLCDQSGITYRVLNRSKGAAVWGPRAQIDRKIYKRLMQREILERTDNLTVEAGAVEDLVVLDGEKPQVQGVLLEDGRTIFAKTVVITTGTFLRGEIFIGMESRPAGRIDEKASYGLSNTLERLGFKLGRLRTGTPARIYKNSIAYDRCEIQKGDAEPSPFSFLSDKVWIDPEKQVPTYLTRTTAAVPKLVKDNLHLNRYVSEEINSPRHCPSLEAKIIKFSMQNHQVWLEDEGLDSDLVYPQGAGTYFPPDIQLKIMREIVGLENCQMARPGYGVCYDFVDPRQLRLTLETRIVDGLFLAGQINGTTGYEEAAAQGIVAGINAAAKVRQEEGMVIDRTEGYVGVLIDDLTTLGTNEPYRMFTTRAEFRLHLRPDNADMRLTEKGRRWKVVGDHRFEKFNDTKRRFELADQLLSSVVQLNGKWKRLLPNLPCGEGGPLHQASSGLDLLHKYNVGLDEICDLLPEMADFRGDRRLEERLRIDAFYRQHNKKLLEQMNAVRKEAACALPDDVDYANMQSLSYECREKLAVARPQTLGAASRIPGITPTALVELLRFVRLRNGAEYALNSVELPSN
uniref:Protein MTO1 homolog, mitochondrial n=1 Tax=Plectus sambesii TaxID=2011161 RepID=A0A914W0H0_9BILA